MRGDASQSSAGDGHPELRAVLRQADRAGLDPWRVAVALGIPAATRDALLEELRAEARAVPAPRLRADPPAVDS